ncbi:MAG: hypothetical protein R6U51_10080 [Anaerolineales bacterium]
MFADIFIDRYIGVGMRKYRIVNRPGPQANAVFSFRDAENRTPILNAFFSSGMFHGWF